MLYNHLYNHLLVEYKCTFDGEVNDPLAWGCNFIQSQDDDVNWMMHQGETPSDSTGPKVDHTKGDNTGQVSCGVISSNSSSTCIEI